MPNFTEVEILSNKTENEGVHSFQISPVPLSFSARKPGQYLLIKTMREGVLSEAHPFTITNSIKDDFLRISVKRIGKFTTALHSIKPPVTAFINGPFGELGNKIDSNTAAVFIAGGIGITPFISLLTHLEDKQSNMSVTLFWANEDMNDLFYLDQLSALTAKLNLSVILVVNRLDEKLVLNTDSLIFEKGYLTKEILDKYIAVDNASYYMCGSPNMQKFIFSQLESMNISPERVVTERSGLYMAEINQ